MKKVFTLIAILALATSLLMGCAGVPFTSPDQNNSAQPGFGTIEVRVTDAPKYDVSSVVIYFSEVSVHQAGAEEEQEQEHEQGGQGEQNQEQEQEQEQEQQGGGSWIDLPIASSSFDLVELGKADIDGLLASGEGVEAGKYTQIRLVIDEAEGKGVRVTYKDEDDVVHENVPANLPSGVLKFVHPFNVVDSTTTIITVDFDVEKSVTFTGGGKEGEPKVIVKPVVKLEVEQAAEEPEPETAPTVTSVTPNSGNQGQTLDVTIGGTHLNGATAVSLGANITINSFTVDNNAHITANITIAADAALGARDVSVTTPGGIGSFIGGFTVTAPTV